MRITLILFIFLTVVGFAFVMKPKQPTLQKIDINALQELTNLEGDSLYVINFWATWCAPCVAELPYFDSVARNHKDKVAIKLVSMDFENKAERVASFLAARKFQNMNYFLITDTNYDAWMTLVHADWSGSIPATLIYNKQKNIRYFHEGAYTSNQLNQLIDSLLQIK